VVKDSGTILEVVTPWSLSTHGYCSQWSALVSRVNDSSIHQSKIYLKLNFTGRSMQK